MDQTLPMLVVRQRPFGQTELGRLCSELNAHFELDAYTARMNVNGVGLSLLTRGEPAVLQRIGGLLERYRLPWAVMKKVQRSPQPMIVRRFVANSGGVRFEGRRDEMAHIPADAPVLVLLSGMDGQIIGKMMRAQQWSGRNGKPMTRKDQYRTILANKPVVDIMQLPSDRGGADPAPISHVRIEAGRFEPTSLGDAMTNSSTQNMTAALKLINSLFRVVHLDMDFGLSQLPGCLPDFSRGDDPFVNRRVLDNYAHYLFQFECQQLPAGRRRSVADIAPDPAVAAVATLATGSVEAGLALGAAAAMAQPEAAREMADDFPGTDGDAPLSSPDAVGPSLPDPPPPETQRLLARRIAPRQLVGLAIGVLVVLFALAALETEVGKAAVLFLWRNGIVSGLASLGLLWGSATLFRRKRWMDNTPTSRVRSLAMGLVEISGVAERAYNLYSPISNIACVWYRIRRYVLDNRGQNGKNWRLVSTQHSGNCPFYLKDDTGRVLVDAGEATVQPSHSSSYGGAFPGLNLGAWVAGPDERIEEELIPEHQQIYVLGYTAKLNAVPKSLRQRLAERLKTLKQNHDELMRFDANGDGRIDDGEWHEAVIATKRKLITDMAAGIDEQPAGNEGIVITAPPVKGMPFIIATEKEQKLSLRYGIYSGLAFAAALGALVLATVQVVTAVGGA